MPNRPYPCWLSAYGIWPIVTIHLSTLGRLRLDRNVYGFDFYVLLIKRYALMFIIISKNELIGTFYCTTCNK